MFKTVIVRKPAKSIINGITSNPQLGKPIYEKALRQHEAYVQALEKCDVTVELLKADERYPDSWGHYTECPSPYFKQTVYCSFIIPKTINPLCYNQKTK